MLSELLKRLDQGEADCTYLEGELESEPLIDRGASRSPNRENGLGLEPFKAPSTVTVDDEHRISIKAHDWHMERIGQR